MSSNGTASKKYDFFISYSNADSKTVEPIVRAMERNFKASCWFQLNNSKHEYVEEIIKGIESSSVFIIFISRNSALSNNVLNEIHYALSWFNSHDSYKILPIVINEGDFTVDSELCRKIRFYLNRFNMLFLEPDTDKFALISQIFEQTGFNIQGEALMESCYHTSEIEAKRLRSQNEILKQMSNYIFEELVTPRSVILDVGCASGANILLRLEGLEYGRLLGVDIDEAQISHAKQTYGSERNDFFQCDVTAEDFEELMRDYLEQIDATGFDVINVSSMLLHQTKPVEILKSLRRVLRSTGSIFIQEEDDGTNVVYPKSAFFDNAFEIWLDSKESGDRFCARKIPSYLKTAGFKSVSLKKCGISNIDLPPEMQEAFWDIYFNYHLWEGLEEDLFYNRARTMKLVEDYCREYDSHLADFMNGKYFIQLGFLFFVAKK